MKVARFVTLAHFWLGLVLGVLIALWAATGAVMGLFDSEKARGVTHAAASLPVELDIRSYANPGGVLARTPGAYELRLKGFLDRAAYEVKSDGGAVLYDAMTGERISPIDENEAREAARRDYVGEGDIDSVRLISDPSHDYQGVRPVWCVTFTDDLHTRLYISPQTGDVVARRNRLWRLYDVFWIPLIRTASVIAALFVLSGFYLVIIRLRTPGAWRWREIGGAREEGGEETSSS